MTSFQSWAFVIGIIAVIVYAAYEKWTSNGPSNNDKSKKEQR